MMKWKLTCFYMGRATSETVSEAELADVWTFVEIGEEIDKCDGGHFEDEDGPKESALAWKGGTATETRCGPWKGGADDMALSNCAGLLTRAGRPALVRGATMEETFDREGENAQTLDALDRAEWMLVALPDAAPPGWPSDEAGSPLKTEALLPPV